MKQDIYRILYCSRNSMQDSPDPQLLEIRAILSTSRKNNAADEITGALLFNSGCFAQVLEGPLEKVEAAFERIQRDFRHAQVTVLEASHVSQREFPEWSMAFAGSSEQNSTVFAEFKQGHSLIDPSAAAMEINGMLSTLVVQEDDYVSNKAG